MNERELFAAHGLAHAGSREATGDSLTERFMRHVRRTADGHWVWTGQRTLRGYGIFVAGGARRPARRFAFEMSTKLAEDELLLQTCDYLGECLLHLRTATKDEIMAHARDERRRDGHFVNARAADYRSRLSTAVSTSIPHVEAAQPPLTHLLSTRPGARNEELSTHSLERDDDGEPSLGENDQGRRR